MKNHLCRIVVCAMVVSTAAISPSNAASNLNSSKSNIYKAISTAADEAACLKAGGTVIMQNEKKVCSIPATNLNSSRSN